MRKGVTALLLFAFALAANTVAVTAAPPPIQITPPGQISIVTINARQHRTLGIKRFQAMFELSKALRDRPTAFDGGPQRATMPPDVIVVSEITPSNAEIFERQLRQRFDQADYRIVGATDTKAFVIADTFELQSVSHAVWEDECANQRVLRDQPGVRRYQQVRLKELDTGTDFTVAAIHLAKNYTFTGERDCHLRNIQKIRGQLEREQGPVLIAGDFNKRSVEVERECDPEEASSPLQWWSELVTPSNGRAYVDAIKFWHLQHRTTMSEEWTHEQKSERTLCTGFSGRARTRIDYIFVGDAVVAGAHTDHPGWAGPQPGTRNKGVYKYSDHRFVWARVVLTGPSKPNPPTSNPGPGGIVSLSWGATDGAGAYVLFRAIGRQPYSILTQLPGDTFTFEDRTAVHGKRHRYAIAAVGSNGGQGQESRGTFVLVDAFGPRIIATRPHSGATGVQRRLRIVVYYDERVEPASVTPDTIALFTSRGRRISGVVSQLRGDILAFDPSERLDKRKVYAVQVQAVADAIGNFGRGYSFQFTTGRR
ncbi:MAG TPA: Ig-like domain-containing protein [Actinomycetota bacterium]|nr:Ig-like domain-containing protein [Actinomycetota bacterium]